MAERHRDQRLAAILAADVAGYSRLMEADERETVASLEACRDIFRKHTNALDGRIVDTTGDSVLAVFRSTIGAVEAAVAIQNDLRDRNRARPDDRRMAFRIGVNLGDVIEKENGSVFGSGVNVAARLEALSEAGGVCLSGSAHEQIEGKLDLSFEDFGEHEVKNIARAVRAFRIVGDANAVFVAAKQARSPSERPSIAVLAFENLSGDLEQEYLADGITEDLITGLSRLRWLQVTARNSSFTYKGKTVDVRQVGRELGVGYVVEGSVRKGGERVRINAQLIDAGSGKHLWAERYDRGFSDIFALQDEITETLVGRLQAEVGTQEQERARRKLPKNLDAWECYQKGMWHIWKYTRPDLAEARQLFARAISLDPDFAQARAAAAFAIFLGCFLNDLAVGSEELDEALQLANQAIDLDGMDALAHMVLGRVHTLRGDYAAAIKALQSAIALNSCLGIAHSGLAMALTYAGRPQEAIAPADIAIHLSQRDPAIWGYYSNRAFVHLLSGNFEAAADDAQRATNYPAAIDRTYSFLVAALAHLGRDAEAKQALAKLLKLNPTFEPDDILMSSSPLNPEAIRPLWQPLFEGLRKAGWDFSETPRRYP